MIRFLREACRFGMALVAAAGVALAPGTVDPSDPGTIPPSAAEMTVLAELSDWVVGPSPDGFTLGLADNLPAAIRAHPRSFELFRRFNDSAARRARVRDLPYGSLIVAAAARHRVDSLLVAAVVETESSFRADAVSVAGALGLMQVMPEVAAQYRVADPLEPAANIELGSRHLSWLLRQYDGDLELALAAYNAGPGSVSRFGGVPPWRETRSYVDRVLTRYVDHHKALWHGSNAGDWLLF